MNTNNANFENAASTSAEEMIPGTNWTWSAAASMAKECQREDRLFPKSRRTSRPSLTAAQRYARRAAKFLAQTGWTLADAMNEAIDARREARLFGPAVFASI